MKSITLLLLAGLSLGSTGSRPSLQEAAELYPGPRELGRVHFSRDFAATLAAAKRSGKPVLALFQEVPG